MRKLFLMDWCQGWDAGGGVKLIFSIVKGPKDTRRSLNPNHKNKGRSVEGVLKNFLY